MDTPTADKPAYRVLARKYRPSDFSALIGQEPMVRTLTNAFAAGRIAQAWMLTGVRGVGKTTTARILARALNYKRGDIDAPTVDLAEPGEHCEAIMEGSHIDIVEMDAASHTGIDDIKQIIDGVRYAPVSARYKVYIIDEIHMLSDKAFNALLKTLEEPPPHAKFIFATTEIRKVPITVLSRCQRFDLRRIEPDRMLKHLEWIAEQEDVQVETDALALIARAGEGSVRDALSILDQAIAHSADKNGSGEVRAEAVRAMLGLADRARIVDLFEHIMAGRVADALSDFRSQYDAGADPAVVLTDLAQFTHLVSRLHYVPETAQRDVSLSPDERERGLAFSEQLPVTVLARAWQMLLKGIPDVETASHPMAAAEMVLIRLAHASTLPTLDEALRKLEDAPSGGAPRPLVTQPSAPSTAPTQKDVQPDAVGQTAPSPPPQGEPVKASAQGGSAVRLIVNEPENEPEPQPMAVAPPAEPPSSGASITSLQDLADLAEQNREPYLRAQIRKFLRLVSVADGRLAVNLTDDAPKTLPGELSQKLKDWTGHPWMVTMSTEQGGATLEEEDRAQRDAMLDDASRDPVVAKLLASFPGSRVIDVRMSSEVLDEEPIDLTAEPVDDGVSIDPSDD